MALSSAQCKGGQEIKIQQQSREVKPKRKKNQVAADLSCFDYLFTEISPIIYLLVS